MTGWPGRSSIADQLPLGGSSSEPRLVSWKASRAESVRAAHCSLVMQTLRSFSRVLVTDSVLQTSRLPSVVMTGLPVSMDLAISAFAFSSSDMGEVGPTTSAWVGLGEAQPI